MRAISSLEPTRYEVTAKHRDGRTYLICYASGSPSGRRLLGIIQDYGPRLVARLGLPDDATLTLRRGALAQATVGDWSIGFSGRTQRDVRGGIEHAHYSTLESAHV